MQHLQAFGDLLPWLRGLCIDSFNKGSQDILDQGVAIRFFQIMANLPVADNTKDELSRVVIESFQEKLQDLGQRDGGFLKAASATGSFVAAGLIDHVLPPDDMQQKICRLTALAEQVCQLLEQSDPEMLESGFTELSNLQLARDVLELRTLLNTISESKASLDEQKPNIELFFSEVAKILAIL